MRRTINVEAECAVTSRSSFSVQPGCKTAVTVFLTSYTQGGDDCLVVTRFLSLRLAGLLHILHLMLQILHLIL